jgi:hypothetical protein
MKKENATMPTPNCDLVKTSREPRSQLQTCGEFLEFIKGRFVLCVHPALGREGLHRPARINEEKILAEFFGVDLDALDREKRAILESIREARR